MNTDEWRRAHDLPTRDEELAIPEGLSPEGQKAAETIVAFATEKLGERPETGGCTTFYTPQQWRDRKEEYGLNSELIVVYDGGDIGPFFNYDYECYKLVDGMIDALDPVGVYPEPCTGWYTAIYKK